MTVWNKPNQQDCAMLDTSASLVQQSQIRPSARWDFIARPELTFPSAVRMRRGRTTLTSPTGPSALNARLAGTVSRVALLNQKTCASRVTTVQVEATFQTLSSVRSDCTVQKAPTCLKLALVATLQTEQVNNYVMLRKYGRSR